MSPGSDGNAAGPAAEDDLALLPLDVYDTARGLWNPEHGDVELPAGWEHLPTGDAFVTRTVKAAGPHWTLWRPRGRNRPHRRKLGLLAPAEHIAAARAEALATETTRSGQRQRSAADRRRRYEREEAELAGAVLAYLAFAPEHAELARTIAEEAARRAAQVGSGRVGRTRTRPLEERAALAARAWIRHRHTGYETWLASVPSDDGQFEADECDEDEGVGDPDERYGAARARAQEEVDAFLARHRSPGTAG